MSFHAYRHKISLVISYKDYLKLSRVSQVIPDYLTTGKGLNVVELAIRLAIVIIFIGHENAH